MADHFYPTDGMKGLKKLRDLKPDLFKAFVEFDNKVFEEGALSVKTKELIVGIRDAGNQEVKIILEAPVGKVEPGTVIEFEGAVAKEFTADPFLRTVEVENDKATGRPRAGGPARGVPKKAAPKKK